jgi:hypothetical protein
MSFETVLPVITLLIGWFMKTFDDYVRNKAATRKVLGKVIADLLEIRHRLIVPRVR